jgi:glycine dehydrogenase subunit 1
MDYIPHTPEDQRQLMESVGIRSIDDLFTDIPEKYRLKALLDLPSALSEQDVSVLMKGIGSRNTIPPMTLMGAGVYHHYIPAVVGNFTRPTPPIRRRSARESSRPFMNTRP